jgi:rubrerythrin
MQALPEGAPATLSEAFARISTCKNPSLFELQLMVFIEAAGKELYGALAADAPSDAVKELLLANGREELAHAHRVSRAIGHLTGTDYPVPAAEDNPYLAGPIAKRQLTSTMLTGLAQSEFAGDDLYKQWSDHCANPSAAELFRQNGREELRHGGRLQEAAQLIEA